MKITLLGTGTSSGVPEIGCACKVCTSKDPRDKRLRVSALVEIGKIRILIDCGPDFRQQIMPFPFAPIDAVLLTHEHYDHIGGLDDLRPFTKKTPVNVFGFQRTLDVVKRQMPYCFESLNKPRVPHMFLHPVQSGKEFEVKSVTGSSNETVKVLPIEVKHGELPILGYRIGTFAFITDMKSISSESFALLNGVDTLIVNGLRVEEHPTHQTVSAAVKMAEEIGASQVRIIHMAHSAGLHAESASYLPAHIAFGYDGEVISVEE